MSVWRQEVPTEGSVELPPDPRALDTLGRNHSLETALADLVDNSVDAGAKCVLIRFVRRGVRLVGLYVVDNGRGIAPEAIDAAMTVGGRREYGTSDLGRFGLGLKAASFSQAGSLTVLSRAAGKLAVGRRWELAGHRRSFRCDVVSTDFAASELDRDWSVPSVRSSGTVVRWDRVSAFPQSAEPERVDEFISRTITSLRGHLGLMFHRFLTASLVKILIDVEDVEVGVGLTHRVDPLDPFEYSGKVDGWPKNLVAEVDGAAVTLRCHIWPRRSNMPQYSLPGGAEQRQGLYFYRRDRLLQAGGWEGIYTRDKKLQLARASIDIDGDVPGMFVMNPEKSKVSAGPRFARAVGTARAADGTTVADYLQAAEATWTRSNQRRSKERRPVIPPGKGLHPKVCWEIREELSQRKDEPPLDILWTTFTSDDFFEVDREQSTLWLNRSYRTALLGGRRGGLNDAPVLKTLLFILTHDLFEGVHLGARDKDNIVLWQELLTAAAKAERSTYESRT